MSKGEFDLLKEAQNKFKEACKDFMRSTATITKRALEASSPPPSKEEEVVEEPEPETKKTQTTEIFTCAGKCWLSPAEPCGGGPKSTIKDGIKIIGENGKNVTRTVCRGCKLERDKMKRAEKKK